MKAIKSITSHFKNNQRSVNIAFVLIFVVVGVGLLIATRAASPSFSVETEGGTRSGSATVISDTTASGGKAIAFGSTPVTRTNKDRIGMTPGSPYLNPPNISEDEFWNKTKDMGVGWIRVDFFMGSHDIRNEEHKLQQAKKHGFNVVATLLGAPSDDDKIPKATRYQDYANFAGQFMAYWKATYPGTVKAVEVMNEVNGSYGNFGNGAPDYTDVLRRTYAQVKAKDSSVTIMNSGFAPAGGNWEAHTTDGCASDGGWRSPATFLEDMYRNNNNTSAGIFDAVAHHPYDAGERNYGQGPCNTGGYRPVHWLRKVMNSHGDNAKKIWGTEAGWQPQCGNEQASVEQFDWQMNDWFYGTHDSSGRSIGTNPAGGDWNTGPFMIYKLYKVWDQPEWGLIFNNGQCGAGYHESALFTHIKEFNKKTY